jgi:hypothetical protein
MCEQVVGSKPGEPICFILSDKTVQQVVMRWVPVFFNVLLYMHIPLISPQCDLLLVWPNKFKFC